MFGKRLRLLREEKGLTLEGLANAYNKRFFGGLNKGTLSKYENNKQEPMISVVRNLAEYFNVTIDYLTGKSDSKDFGFCGSEECLNFPVIGEVAAGYGSFAEENATGDFEQIPLEWIKGHSKDDFFVLRVKGNSMYPEFKNGDHVLIKRCSSVDSGNVAVVIYDSEEATLKKVKYVQGEDWLDLVPINPEYETKHIENSDLEECRVLGEAVKIIRHLK